MAQWWIQDTKPVADPRRRAVAYYRHSADIGQENSVEIQQDNVRAFAAKHDIEIVHEFADRAKSGLNAEGRPEFNEMMQWVTSRDDFAYILVLNVSRWGRFQDTDLSAHYEALCRQAGKQVVYTNIGFAKDEDQLVDQLRKSIDRYQSADYVRTLSKTTFDGAIKVASQGYRPGGAPPYGFYRMMLDEKKQPDRILEPGQRKGLQKGRTILVPGDAVQIQVVRDIFTMFVHEKLSPAAIAQRLNARGVPPPGRPEWNKKIVARIIDDEQYRLKFDPVIVRDILAMSRQARLKPEHIARILRDRKTPPPFKPRWHERTVLSILTDEQYRGCVVYNRTRQKMKSGSRRNPRAVWIITPEAYEPLVSPELFAQASERLAEPARRRQPETMLASLRALFEKYHVITPLLIRSDANCPPPGCYDSRFGSLTRAYQAMFGQIIERTRGRVVEAISRQADAVEVHDDFIVVNESFTVLIQPVVPVPDGYGLLWWFRPDHRPVIDITLGVPLADTSGDEILGYLALPRLMVPPCWVRLSGGSNSWLELHGYNGLDLIRDLINLKQEEQNNGQDSDPKHEPEGLPDDPGGQGEGDQQPDAGEEAV